MTRVLLLGGGGQVGAELQRIAPPNWSLLAPNRSQLDLSALETLESKISALQPDAIINAAAYTAVDKAEDETALAHTINGEAPERLAHITASRSIPLIHISTDYVFDGAKAEPYVELDPINPLGAYGRSKAQGEAAILAHSANAAVVRTSWVFSAHGANFVKAMLRLGADRSEVRVVADQYGRPTPARDLGAACVNLAERLLRSEPSATGVFHFAGAGTTSWALFAETIFKEAERRRRAPVRVQHITSSEYPTRAQRPANSALNTDKITALGITPPAWIHGLRACLDELLGPAA